MTKTFAGGVHPRFTKENTFASPIDKVKAPAILVFPLQQHVGKDSVPIVSVGERVKSGQKIAEPGGPVSSALHSSVSGRVIALEKRIGPDRKSVV